MRVSVVSGPMRGLPSASLLLDTTKVALNTGSWSCSSGLEMNNQMYLTVSDVNVIVSGATHSDQLNSIHHDLFRLCKVENTKHIGQTIFKLLEQILTSWHWLIYLECKILNIQMIFSCLYIFWIFLSKLNKYFQRKFYL